MFNIQITELKEGMKIASNVYDSNDNIIIDMGSIVTKSTIELLKKNSIETVSVVELIENKYENNFDNSIKNQLNKRVIIEENGKEILKIDSEKALDINNITIEKTKNAYNIAKNNGTVDFIELKKDVDIMLNSILENREAHSYLAILKRKDESIYKHAVDVAALSAITAIEMNLTKADISNIMLGALLHDIGKVLVQEYLLNKKNLTADEINMLKKHTTHGYKLAKRDNLEDNIADIILEHHEKYDGSGYPFGKENRDIGLYSKVVSIANKFNNLIVNGNDGLICTADKAMKIIISLSKKDFDMDIVKHFQKAIGFYPNNTKVKLSNGQTARVIQQNNNLPLRPILSIMKNEDGTDANYLEVVDLSKSNNLFIKEVLNYV
ncbi:HD domain-containing protein [Brachyspira pilosicoli]|uniref:HD-GYP domain-containing protein n=1 Tax=Brachyspira pilosicoli TaxID=52584 RepID=UPI0030066012